MWVVDQVSSVQLSVVKCEFFCAQDEAASLELLNVLKEQPMTLQVLQVITGHVQTVSTVVLRQSSYCFLSHSSCCRIVVIINM